MKSSKMDKIYNYSPVPEETKSLSPLTYYQPFQSTFDPEFAMQSPKDPWRLHGDREDSRMRWGHPAEKQTGNPHMPAGSRILNPCEHNRPGSYPESSKAFPTASTSSWRGENRNQSLMWSDYTQRHSFPHCGENPKGLGSYAPFLQSGDGRGAGFGMLDSSYRVGTAQSAVETTGYSLFGHHGKNAFKTGQTRPKMCNFCKNNKEVPDIYLNHYLYDPETKVLTCPVLRKHVCEICGETGDRAHTLQYCPENRKRGLQAKVPVLLKTRTITNSTGKIRRN